MRIVEKNAVSTNVHNAGCGSIVEYFDISKGVVYTCLVGKAKDTDTYLLMDVVTGEVFEVSGHMYVTHYTKASLHLEED